MPLLYHPSDGRLDERLRLVVRARRAGSELRWPVRLPAPQGRRTSRQVVIGERTTIGPRLRVSLATPKARLVIGGGCTISEMVVVSCADRVEIGDGCGIANGVQVYDHLHDMDSFVLRGEDPTHDRAIGWGITEPRPVSIGAGSLIGANVVIMPGVTIGVGASIGSNAVVTRDVPDYGVAAGVPARLLRTWR